MYQSGRAGDEAKTRKSLRPKVGELASLEMAKKVRGFSGIWTHGLYVSTAVLYQLSYEDPYPWEQANFFHELKWTQ